MAGRKGFSRPCNLASNYDEYRDDPNRDFTREVREKMKEISEKRHEECKGNIRRGSEKVPCLCRCHKKENE